MNDSPSSDGFRVEQIDHVELFVPNREQAAEWYRRVLGLDLVAEYAHWARDPRGPLMISGDSGSTKLALFEGAPQGPRKTAGFHRVAFRVGAAAFAEFLRRLPDLDLTDDRGRHVTSELVVDHESAYSIYLCDPFGHRLELTTYAHDEATAELKRLSEAG